MFDEPGPVGDDIDAQSARPDAAILCYPVVSFLHEPHPGSLERLLGADAPEPLRREMSVETRVDDRTPPIFCWHTADDAVVPVSHSLRLARALAQAHRPFALHVYPHGAHGVGLRDTEPAGRLWPGQCAAWLAEIGFTPDAPTGPRPS
jgi:acetyl esterase/lipase